MTGIYATCCLLTTDYLSLITRLWYIMTGMMRPEGFTIIEVMIFLVISAAMFVSGTLLFRGVHQRNQFAQSMRDIESVFQDVINDVSTGYFDQLSGHSCLATPGSFPTFVAIAAEQGTNKDCIFLGKIVLLLPNSVPEQIEATPVLGNRKKADGRNVETIGESSPTTAYNRNLPLGQLDMTSSYTLRWGARIKSATPSNFGGFYSSLAKYAPSGNTISESGSLRVDYFAHSPSALTPQTRNGVKTCVESAILAVGSCFGSASSPNPWVICFENGNGGETARLTVGAGNTLTTKLEFVSC